MKFKLDDVDHKILDLLIDNSRIPFTDIAKKLLISAGTVHVRVKKMEDAGIIKGSSLKNMVCLFNSTKLESKSHVGHTKFAQFCVLRSKKV